MRWGTFLATVFIAVFILFILWPRIQSHPKKDKTVFVMFLLFCTGLSIFDLPTITGPLQWLKFIFKPLVSMMD